MDTNKYKGTQLKDGQKYTFIFIGIGMTFVCASALVLFAKETDMKDLYAAFSGIIGGLIGGLVTLEGVRRTVYAQTDIESLKLVPQKLIHLHKLKKEMKFLENIRDKVSFWESEMKCLENLDYGDESEEIGYQLISLLGEFEEIRRFSSKSLEDEEYRFIEIVSEIDLNIYHKTRQLFEELSLLLKPLNTVIQSVEVFIKIPGEKHFKNILDLSNQYNKGEIGEETFITYINSSNVTCGHIVKDIQKTLPFLHLISYTLDRKIKELNVMVDAKFKEFKELDKKIL